MPVNEAARAEIADTRETFELTINQIEKRAIQRWESPKVDSAGRVEVTEEQSVECLRSEVRCFDYKLRVSYPYHIGSVRLRVGLQAVNVIGGENHSTVLNAKDIWGLVVIHPDGTTTVTVPDGSGASATAPLGIQREDAKTNSQQDTRETFVDLRSSALDGGIWTVRLVASAVNLGCSGDPQPEGCEPAFARLRAILEAEPTNDRPPAPLYPDLIAIPPFNLNFGGDLVRTDGGTTRNGCIAADKAMLEGTITRTFPEVCLRAAFGFGNVGAGPLELRFTVDHEASLAQRKPVAKVEQHVFRRDATPWDYSDNDVLRPTRAGTASYHETHGHWHYDGLYVGRLFQVDKNGMFDPHKPVKPAEKRGSCAHDGILLDFAKTYQDAVETNDSGDDCQSAAAAGHATPAGNRIGLSRGWADIYGQSTADQYFDFGGLGDGTYLAQIEIDPDHLIAEVDRENNYGYVLFTVDGYNRIRPVDAKIKILERGRGRSHLDPKKVRLIGIAE